MAEILYKGLINISQLINSVSQIPVENLPQTTENLNCGGLSDQTEIYKCRQVVIGRALGEAAEHDV